MFFRTYKFFIFLLRFYENLYCCLDLLELDVSVFKLINSSFEDDSRLVLTIMVFSISKEVKPDRY